MSVPMPFAQALEVPMSVPLSALPLVDLLDLVGRGDCTDADLHTGPDGFDTESDLDRMAREDVAKDVCQSCPVRSACLEYAFRAAPEFGVWAGHTAAELARLNDTARTAQIGEAA